MRVEDYPNCCGAKIIKVATLEDFTVSWDTYGKKDKYASEFHYYMTRMYSTIAYWFFCVKAKDNEEFSPVLKKIGFTVLWKNKTMLLYILKRSNRK